MKKVTKEINKLQNEFICIDIQRCRNCAKCRCIEGCPEKIIGRSGSFFRKHLTIQYFDKCTGCKNCIVTCPYKIFSEI